MVGPSPTADQDRRDRALDEVQEEAWEEPEHDDERRQRDERDELDRADVGQVLAEPGQELRGSPVKIRWNIQSR